MAEQEFTGTARFEVKRRLGAGGMGVVYLAWDRERRHDVALKLLLRLDAEGIYKLKAEFRALADTSHPNLIDLYELHSADDAWFFTMELLDGVDFLTWVRAATGDEAREVIAGTAHDIESAATMADVALESGSTLVDDGFDIMAGRTLDALTTRPAHDSGPTPAAPMVRAELVARAAPVVRMGRPVPEARLRPALRQLCEGVAAIHAAGKLHRDIKPSNAIVTHAGRVVLLDFGLVSDQANQPARRRYDSGMQHAVTGTPAYMAPEQVSGRSATAASDWYAVGVMLYEALTGDLPFRGTWLDILQQKQTKAAVPPHLANPDAPADLCALCQGLLAMVPTQRPQPAAILQAVGAEVAPLWSPPDELAAPPFLGRRDALDALDAWADGALAAQRPAAMHVMGPGGVGKTTLLENWGEARSTRGTLVLLARCHERESVPYKAFDSLIDALTRWLRTLDARALDSLLPRDVAALAMLFPVMRRVESVARASVVGLAGFENRALRRKAFAAMKDLLRRLAARGPVVLGLDDLQWGDGDSVELLAALLEPPDAPRVLWLLGYRDTELNCTPVLAALRALAGPGSIAVQSAELRLAPLAPTDARDLALSLLGSTDAVAQRRAEVIAKESQGSPLFVMELVGFRGDAHESKADVTNPELTLDAVLGARLAHLPVTARRLLDAVAVAGRPIAQRRAFAAVGLDNREQAALQRLRTEHLVRTTGTGEADLIEPFHNRIREIVASLITSGDQQTYHRGLAQAYLEPLPGALDARLDVDALALHCLAAGEEVDGLRWTLEAAERAHSVYANLDALRHYDVAIALLRRGVGSEPAHTLVRVLEAAAEVARQAGQYVKAIDHAGACLPLARSADHAADVRVLLGRAHQEKGDTAEAIVHLETALQHFGRRAPHSLLGLGLQIGKQFSLHLLYTLLPRLAGTRSDDPRHQKLADTMFALTRIYYFVDVGKVVWAGMTTMNLARRMQRDADVALAYSFYGVLLFGMGMMKRSAHWCERAADLARTSGQLAAEAITSLRMGTHAIFANDLKRGERQLHDALRDFDEVGEVWEAQTCRMMIATGRFLAGEFDAAEPVYEEMGATGAKLNATMHQGWCLGWAPFCRYLRGRTDAATARAELDHAIELSAQVGDIANTSAALMHCAAVAVREGRVEMAAGLAIRVYECISKYLVQVPFLQNALCDAGEAALFALEHNATSVKRSTLERIAVRGWRKARGMSGNYPYLLGPSLRIEARWTAWKRGPDAAAPVFKRALDVLERSPNRWETGVAYYDAARCLPDQCDVYARRARRIFEELGAVAELRRMDREQGVGYGTDSGKHRAVVRSR
ncbi:MAG: tetratricopeptide repeat protein [Myxococcales bacterium]|nr:tetratricopeptide repeat protein [Myxococcales bacterium]